MELDLSFAERKYEEEKEDCFINENDIDVVFDLPDGSQGEGKVI